MDNRRNSNRDKGKEQIIPIEAFRGSMASRHNARLDGFDELLTAIRAGIGSERELAHIATSYFAYPLEGRLAVLSTLADDLRPELLDFLKVAALDEKVAPCLEVASVTSGIVDERSAGVLKILLAHDDKSVRRAAREVLFALRGKGLALPLEDREPLPATTLPWWTAECPVYKIAFWATEGKGKVGSVVARERYDGLLAVFGFFVDATGNGIEDCFYAPEFDRERFDTMFISQARKKFMTWEGNLKDMEEMAAFGYGLSKSTGHTVPLTFHQGKFLMGPAADRFDDVDLYTCRKCLEPLDIETMDYIRSAWQIELLPEKDFLCADCYTAAGETERQADWQESFDKGLENMEECFNCQLMDDCHAHQDDLLGIDSTDFPSELVS